MESASGRIQAVETKMAEISIRETPEAFYLTFTEPKIQDDGSIEAIGQQLDSVVALAAENGKDITIDFSGVTFFSSPLIGKIVRISQAKKTHGIDVRFKGINESILNAIRLLSLGDVIVDDDSF